MEEPQESLIERLMRDVRTELLIALIHPQHQRVASRAIHELLSAALELGGKPENQTEPSWHYRRVCEACGVVWGALHCPHDGYQNPCPGCGKKPEVLRGHCQCKFDFDEPADTEKHLAEARVQLGQTNHSS